jgi:hypothetical protein
MRYVTFGEWRWRAALARAALGLAVVLTASLADAGDAAARSRKAHKHAKSQVRQPAYRPPPTRGSDSGYVQYDAEKLPFGSSSWWGQMLREGRAGTCCN